MKSTPEDGKGAKIMEVAFQMFLEQGYEATGIRSICKAAEAELPTLYYHFGSKKGLFLSLANSLRQSYEPDVLKTDHTSPATPQDFLRDYFFFSMDYAIHHHPETLFFLRYSLFPPKELQKEVTSFLEENQRSKNAVIMPYMEASIQNGIVKLPINQAMLTYWKFINNNTFDVVFSRWTPEKNELNHLWRTFLHFRLSNEQDVYTKEV